MVAPPISSSAFNASVPTLHHINDFMYVTHGLLLPHDTANHSGHAASVFAVHLTAESAETTETPPAPTKHFK